MTCYQRHLGSLFESLGLEYDKANRARVDAAIRELLGVAESGTRPLMWVLLPFMRKAIARGARRDLDKLKHVVEQAQ